MGEVVVSSCEAMEIEVVDKEKVMEEKRESNKEASSSMVQWENFLPKAGLRVLLVEADDSTRQIIGALLRKCSYKVATASDGLKAWEVLKARPHNIDLILTEMELPSISGYALLTLIMEHEICKNIPVIMMSTYDSVSMVYKCMMRGAADFLVKPIRINELRNLWQHVWRRQSVGRVVHGPRDESPEQEKLEATAENNATSDRSSGSKACNPTREDCLKKGSDAQSSCGKLDLEADSAYTAEVEDFSQPKQGLSPVTELRVQECQNLSTPESAAADTAAYNGNRTLDREQRLEQESHAENVNLFPQPSANKEGTTNSPRQAIDLIGAFVNQSKRKSCPNDGANRYDSSPYLDLSLTRSSPVAPENQISSDNQLLKHSNASAFTRYVHRTVQESNTNAISGPGPNDENVSPGDHLSDNNAPESNFSAKDSMLQYRQKVASVPVNLTKEAENESGNVSRKLFPIPLAMGGVKVDACSPQVGYGSSIPPAVRTLSPSPSPSSANQQMSSYHQFSADTISRQNYNPIDHSAIISSNQPVCRQDQKMEFLEDQTNFSATDQCGSSTLCNDTFGHLNGSEGGNEQTHGTHNLTRQRSLQREAALNKFRLKRKERCYEKKVRYESRKKLAEQRPRVKGQFVRQVPPDPPPLKSDNSGGDSFAY